MNYFNNVNFNFVKDNLTEGILKDLQNIVNHYRNCFLNDPLYFDCVLLLTTTIKFFNNEKNIYETIEFKPLSKEDFLYRNLEEAIFNIKICLIQSLNDIKDKHHLHFFKFYISHTSNGDIMKRI